MNAIYTQYLMNIVHLSRDFLDICATEKEHLQYNPSIQQFRRAGLVHSSDVVGRIENMSYRVLR